ncbi:hypothetical protein [Citricoccus sp. K5]|uniref:hypothetical protein n=1 Tax=Citricoccus sp. K5 TaxID=2653135 RepID=UPI0012F333CA|nr:hypothetical protein [Citricoccus sp. K5]VXB47779.1 hypothetical protein CITRIK5_30638 [Citricoccus sp. K5]
MRTRTDRVDRYGKVSIRYAGKLRHLGLGRAHIGENVLLPIQDNHVTTTNAATGDIIAEHAIDPSKNYQKPLSRTPDTPPHPTTTTRKTNPQKKS